METHIQKTERLIREINQIHFQYSQDYFETGKVAKINLSHTLPKVPIEHILLYRLNLHEAINDYLAFADTRNIDFFYRVKTAESIHDKIHRYLQRENHYPVNNILNDIFGARVILPSESVAEIMAHLDNWKNEYSLKNWYLRDVGGYIGVHVYFKNSSNFYYPWELQIWDERDAKANIVNHQKYKRDFVK
ncbi:GTP pyrophosphokinase [Alysiella crassa]|uniref:Region found in RelA / SpoT proteins n=1 Tax=Alysiella crassa TaxID=153491 RepID=A0A376BTV5_9NEIS|nr:GTP pyrophosphokinase [Alysiella crassa]UOP05846.1 GTP pyrophosphokinase [Alysiella crassa]SSY80268.1 Region found in RelA / SpoT proteins [Alysiella crassa]